VKHFLSTSLPERFSEQARHLELPRLMLNGLSAGGDSESRSASSDSMLQVDNKKIRLHSFFYNYFGNRHCVEARCCGFELVYMRIWIQGFDAQKL
jgi:hypothetical protein